MKQFAETAGQMTILKYYVVYQFMPLDMMVYDVDVESISGSML